MDKEQTPDLLDELKRHDAARKSESAFERDTAVYVVAEMIPAIIAVLERAKQYRRALEDIRDCVGGDNPENGMDSPEDVWGIANAALEDKP